MDVDTTILEKLSTADPVKLFEICDTPEQVAMMMSSVVLALTADLQDDDMELGRRCRSLSTIASIRTLHILTGGMSDGQEFKGVFH